MTHDVVFDQTAEQERIERRLEVARDRVRRTGRATIYTAPAVDRAARLLVDMLDAGAKHGIPEEEWSAVTNLAGACWDVTTAMLHGVDRVHAHAIEQGYGSSQALAIHLVDVLHGRLVDVHGIDHAHRPGSYSIRFSVDRGRFARSVRAGADGWHYDTDGAGRVMFVEAPFDEPGARAVADVIAGLVRGELPDPLAVRY